MTSIESTVTRRGRFDFVRYGPDKAPVVITLSANGSQNDLVTLRLLRRRESYSIDLIDLYALLVRHRAMHKHLAKARGRRKVARKFARLTG